MNILNNVNKDWKMTLLGLAGAVITVLTQQLTVGEINWKGILLAALVFIGGAITKITNGNSSPEK